jgi:phosphoenolpyruvate carboxykinase (ATP)
MITAAMNGELADVDFKTHNVFGLAMPTSCPDVPTELLSPKDTWADNSKYDTTAEKLAASFVKNFAQYAGNANKEILDAAPKVSQEA